MSKVLEHTVLLPAGIAIAAALIFSLTVPHFADPGNILNLFEQLGVLGFLAIGMTFVMIAGGIDLSSYTVVSAAAVVGATAMIDTDSAVLGAALMLLIGMGFGMVNGVAIAYGRMIPFIVTLSTMVLAQGFAIWYTQAQSVYGLPDDFIDLVSGRLFGFFPIPAAIILIVAVIAGITLARSQYGRWVYLTGANEQTALISGIHTRFTKFSTYVISGLMAGITAIVLTAIVGASTTSMVRDERLMDVIAATVIGGASLKGGTGSVLGTMFGLLFITMLGNVFNLLGVSPFLAMVIKGMVLVAVIGIDVLRSR
jgi:ribose/xylose/arabinose/galactoside ABC-type transport system permease subunit